MQRQEIQLEQFDKYKPWLTHKRLFRLHKKGGVLLHHGKLTHSTTRSEQLVKPCRLSHYLNLYPLLAEVGIDPYTYNTTCKEEVEEFIHIMTNTYGTFEEFPSIQISRLPLKAELDPLTANVRVRECNGNMYVHHKPTGITLYCKLIPTAAPICILAYLLAHVGVYTPDYGATFNELKGGATWLN